MIYCIEQGFIHPRYIIRIIFFVLEVILQSLERRNYGKMRQWHGQRNMSQDEQMQGIKKNVMIFPCWYHWGQVRFSLCTKLQCQGVNAILLERHQLTAGTCHPRVMGWSGEVKEMDIDKGHYKHRWSDMCICILHCHCFQLNFCRSCLQLNPWVQVRQCWGLGIQQACSGACDHRMLTLNWMHILVAWTKHLALKTRGKISKNHRTWCGSRCLW